MRIILCTLSILIVSLSSYGQYKVENTPYKVENTQSYGNVKIFKDGRIDALIRKQVAINEVALHHVPGYRIQVITTNNREEAMNARAKVLEVYPDYKTYLSYESPYFKVRVGDFRTREEADQLQKELSQQFSNAVITVRDIININPPDSGGINNNSANNN